MVVLPSEGALLYKKSEVAEVLDTTNEIIRFISKNKIDGLLDLVNTLRDTIIAELGDNLKCRLDALASIESQIIHIEHVALKEQEEINARYIIIELRDVRHYLSLTPHIKNS